jgi:catechol 2,3-dioxygenase-like lactoylglutathione lyase family enzyme
MRSSSVLTLATAALLLLARAVPATLPSDGRDDAVLQVRGAFFGLSVADIDATTRWYEEKLGLRVVMRAPRTDETRSAATVLSGGGLTVELVRHDDARPLRGLVPEGRGALYVHGIFKVGVTVDDLDATLAALRARGVQPAMGPWPRRGDVPANAIIRDAEGNYIQLFGR